MREIAPAFAGEALPQHVPLSSGPHCAEFALVNSIRIRTVSVILPSTTSASIAVPSGPVHDFRSNSAPALNFQTFTWRTVSGFPSTQISNWDFSISKNTKLGERVTLQLRAEFFYILNHPNFSGIDGELADGVCNSATDCSSSAGLAQFTPDIAASNPVLGSGGSRHIQLGAKFLW